MECSIDLIKKFFRRLDDSISYNCQTTSVNLSRISHFKINRTAQTLHKLK